MVETELAKSEIGLLRFVKTPFKVLMSCEDDLFDYEQYIIKVYKHD